MKSKILLVIFSLYFMFSTTLIKASENENVTDNHRIYELINLSDTKNLKLEGSSSIDFSSFDKNENSINGLYKGQYNITNKNNGNATVSLGLIFSSNLENLKDFSIFLDEEKLDYKIKFLTDKFKIPTGDEFYKEILENISSNIDIKNYKKEDVGVVRLFNIETENIEDLSYEIIVKYSLDKTKVFLTGGKEIEQIDQEDDKKDSKIKVLKLTHDLSGKYRKPVLFAIGDDINIITKVYSKGKEINTGYRENIEKKSISIIDFFKENLLEKLPKNLLEKLSSENIFEIFSENFDKVLGASGYDNIGILDLKNEKQIFLSFEFPIESKKMRKLNISYPITSSLTTINSENVMKLNLEKSPLSTFDNFNKIEYKIIGNNEYKYIVDANVKYKNEKENSTFSITNSSNNLIETLLYKENYLKGITKKHPKLYTNYILILFSMTEIIAVIYLKNIYFKNKKYKR